MKSEVEMKRGIEKNEKTEKETESQMRKRSRSEINAKKKKAGKIVQA